MSERPFLKGCLIFFGVVVLFIGIVYWVLRLAEGGGPVVGDRLALVRIEGVILDSGDTIDELKKFSENPNVKGILIRINSPGGAVVPSQEIYKEVKKIQTEFKKKVVVSMGTVAASGGYYIASASDWIIANPGTLTGSIGVIMELMTVEGLLKKVGLESVVIKSGARKDVGSPFRAMTKEERAYLQTVIDDIQGQFVDAVARGRGMKREEVVALADGRIFTGKQALKNRLVDELGDLEDAIRVAGKMSGISGTPKVVEVPKKFSFSDLLKNQVFGGTAWEKIQKPGMPGVSYLWTIGP